MVIYALLLIQGPLDLRRGSNMCDCGSGGYRRLQLPLMLRLTEWQLGERWSENAGLEVVGVRRVSNSDSSAAIVSWIWDINKQPSCKRWLSPRYYWSPFFSLDTQRFSENPRGSKSTSDWCPSAGVKVKLSSNVTSEPAWIIRHWAIFNSASDTL